VHEPVEGELIWSGGANLTAFIEVRACTARRTRVTMLLQLGADACSPCQVCADAGLFVMLRIGCVVASLKRSTLASC
jgi:hypothetical protein